VNNLIFVFYIDAFHKAPLGICKTKLYWLKYCKKIVLEVMFCEDLVFFYTGVSHAVEVRVRSVFHTFFGRTSVYTLFLYSAASTKTIKSNIIQLIFHRAICQQFGYEV